MPVYQIFRLDQGGRIGLGNRYNCTDLAHAIRLAEVISKGVDQVDIWRGLERVWRIEPLVMA